MARMSTPHDDDDESTLALAAAGKCLSLLVWLHVLLSGSPRLHVLLSCISGSSLLALDTSVASCLDVQQWENSINEAKNKFWFRIYRHFKSKNLRLRLYLTGNTGDVGWTAD